MIEDAIKIVRNHYELEEIVNAGGLHGGFVYLTFVIITGTGGDLHKFRDV